MPFLVLDAHLVLLGKDALRHARVAVDPLGAVHRVDALPRVRHVAAVLLPDVAAAESAARDGNATIQPRKNTAVDALRARIQMTSTVALGHLCAAELRVEDGRVVGLASAKKLEKTVGAVFAHEFLRTRTGTHMDETAAPLLGSRKRPISPSPPPSPSLDDDAVACAGLKRLVPRKWPDPPQLTAKPCGRKKAICKDVHCPQCWSNRVAGNAFTMSMWTGTWEEALNTSCGSEAEKTFQCAKSGHSFTNMVNQIAKKKISCPFPCCRDTVKLLCGNIDCYWCFSASVASHTTAMKSWTGSMAAACLMSKGDSTKVLWKCTKHDHHTWTCEVRNICREGNIIASGCPFPCCCNYSNRLCSEESCLVCLQASVAGDAKAMRKWNASWDEARALRKKSHVKGSWKCINCDFEYASEIANVINGSGCPRCAMSEAETKMRVYLETRACELRWKFEQEWFHSSCKMTTVCYFDFRVDFSTGFFFVEIDGVHHFETIMRRGGPDSKIRVSDLLKMRWVLSNGRSMLRLTAKAVRFFEPQTWQKWLQSAVAEHVVPSARKPVIVLEDCPRYRTMFAECLRDDPALGPNVVFHAMGSI